MNALSLGLLLAPSLAGQVFYDVTPTWTWTYDAPVTTSYYVAPTATYVAPSGAYYIAAQPAGQQYPPPQQQTSYYEEPSAETGRALPMTAAELAEFNNPRTVIIREYYDAPADRERAEARSSDLEDRDLAPLQTAPTKSKQTTARSFQEDKTLDMPTPAKALRKRGKPADPAPPIETSEPADPTTSNP